MRELSGKVGVVTGAASGIGLGIAEAFADAGMHLVLSDVDVPLLEAETKRLHARGVDAIAVPTDVTDPDAVDALGAATLERFGAVHVVCNNAGVVASGLSWELPLLDWRRILDVNLWGVIHGVRTFVPLLLAGGEEGHVVNVGSMASVVPVPRIAPYNVSKHGVLALSETMWQELDDLGAPIGVTVVMPGRVASRLGGGSPDPAAMQPSVVGRQVVEAIRDGRRYCFTHPERLVDVERRFNAILSPADGD